MLDTVINLPAVILGFGALIFFHELGHFVAAKWAGVGLAALPSAWGQCFCPGVEASVWWRIHPGRVVEMTGSPADKLTDEELAQHGLGETEYSLRLLPLGGFVSMLGQEDGKPEAVMMIPEATTSRGRQTNGHHFRGCGDEPHPCDRAVCGCLWHRCEIRPQSSGQPSSADRQIELDFCRETPSRE